MVCGIVWAVTGVEWQVIVVEGLLLKIWKYGKQFSQRKTSGKESSGMRVTSTKQYMDVEERNQIRRRDIFGIMGEQSIKSNAFRHFEMVKW